MAQIVERSLPPPEVRGSNPVIGNLFVYCQLYSKDENKEKEAGNGPFLKINTLKPYLDLPRLGTQMVFNAPFPFSFSIFSAFPKD